MTATPSSHAESITVPSVLLVDDRPANLLALESILEPLGLHTVRAESGEQALKQLLKHEFALILLDVQMPVMDGFDTATAIRAHPRTGAIPIIFVTAINRGADHVFKGYASGAVDYIMKPFDPDILRAKVSIFVDLFRKNQTIKAQAKLLLQREMETLERRNEQRFRRLTDLLPVLMCATRPDGGIHYVNRAWTTFFGSSVDKHRLESPSIIHPDDLEPLRDLRARALLIDAPLEIQCRLRRLDGEYRWHTLRTGAERGDDGHLDGWIVAAVDIDAQKQSEAMHLRVLEAEQHARREAESATNLKDEFLTTVSHELRTPLHSILGWTKMLRAGMLEHGQMEKALRTIERNAEAQRELVDDLLDVSSIVRGKLRLQRRTIDVGAAVAAAVETMRPHAVAKDIRLEVDRPEAAEALWADPERVQQIVWNLVANAIKFTPRGGKIIVKLASEESGTVVTVKDDGAGISPEFLPHVFDRFRQADNTITRTHQGLGLGLSIVRHLVLLHGGNVAVESEGLGKGATFRVTFPTLTPSTDDPKLPTLDGLAERKSGTTDKNLPIPTADPPRRGSDPQSLEGVRVLFVEDDPDARELFASAFRRLGADVTATDSVPEALEALGSGPFDVLVSDIGLRGEDGFSFLKKVRAASNLGARVPAIAVSGFARSEAQKRALDAGFQAYLTKPVEPAELIDVVANFAHARVVSPT
jgi:PAS domain S-box-containing protein